MNVTMSEEIPELPDYAADLETELAFGKLPEPPVTFLSPHDPERKDDGPEQGIRRMEARIKGLQAEMESVLNGPDQTPEALAAAHLRIDPQLEDARRRLAEYEAQRNKRN
jgi:hypothetical protein